MARFNFNLSYDCLLTQSLTYNCARQTWNFEASQFCCASKGNRLIQILLSIIYFFARHAIFCMVWVFHALILWSLAGDMAVEAAVDKSLWRADKQVSEKAVALSPKMSSVCLLPAKCGWLLERLREGVQVDHLCSHHQWCWLWLWPFSAKVSLTRGCRCFVWQSAVFERKKKNNPISTKMKNPTLALWVTLLLDMNIFKTFRSLLQWVLRMPRTTELKLFRLLFFFFLLLPPLCQVVTVTFHFVIFGVDLQMLTSLCNLPFVSWCKLAGSTWLLVCVMSHSSDLMLACVGVTVF